MERFPLISRYSGCYEPLKRRMKIRRGDNRFLINFKYENVPIFCFICGVLGHSEKFCNRLFVTPENETKEPYGDWMRAPFKRQVKPIGAKWLRNRTEGGTWNLGGSQSQSRFSDHNQDPHFTPPDQGEVNQGVILGGIIFKFQLQAGI